jgi:hypothetical protein
MCRGSLFLVPVRRKISSVFMLYKKRYYHDRETDWKVWYYFGGLPLQGNVTYGHKVDNAEWTTLVVAVQNRVHRVLIFVRTTPVGSFIISTKPISAGLY